MTQHTESPCLTCQHERGSATYYPARCGACSDYAAATGRWAHYAKHMETEIVGALGVPPAFLYNTMRRVECNIVPITIKTNGGVSKVESQLPSPDITNTATEIARLQDLLKTPNLSQATIDQINANLQVLLQRQISPVKTVQVFQD